MKKFLYTLIVLGLLTNTQAHNGAHPPVSLPIQNILQQTQVWCWAAVSQQIIYWKTGNSPSQCRLVSISKGTPPNTCCPAGNNPAFCVTTGGMNQIQWLIANFGGSWNNIAPPTDPHTLYHTIASGKAVILHVASSISSSHVVVLRGIYFDQFNNPILYVNDPLNHFSSYVPYASILPIWINAIVVH